MGMVDERYIAEKDKKAFMANLKLVYQALNQTENYENLLKLDENWGKKFRFRCRTGIPIVSLDAIVKDEI